MRETTTEQAKLWHHPALPGVEMMRARYTRQNFTRHFHEGYCLGVIEEGALAFRYRGENLLAPAGSVNLAVPGEVHDGHGADNSGWAYRMFYLEREALAAAAAQFSPRPVSLPHFRPGVIQDFRFAAGLHAFHVCLEQDVSLALEVQTRFLGLMEFWIRGHADERPCSRSVGQEHQGVLRVRDILEDRFSEDLTLSELADEAGLSPYHLARTFTAHVGLPPHTYLIQVRVNRAAARLAGREPIATVAAAVGFSDQSHLTRQFKRFRGVTPGQYQAASRKIVQDD